MTSPRWRRSRPISDLTNYATFWRRALAAFLDNAVWLVAGGYLLSFFPESVYDDEPGVIIVVFFVLASAWFNYFAFTEWRWGQTIGKNATGIEVRSLDGAAKLSFFQASIRNLLRLIDWLVIGELMIAMGRRKQRLGDKAAKTVVLRRPPRAARVMGGATPPVAAPAPKPAPKPSELATPKQPGRRLPVPPWSPRDTAWWVIGGLLLAIVIPPLLVAPFDPDLESDGALLAAQAMFDGLLVVVAVGVASGWRFRPLGHALGLLGLRRFKPSAIGILLATLIAYYIAAGLFASLVLKPDQEDIGGELGVGNPNLAVAVTAVVLIAVVAPITEELFFRGFLFAGLRGRWSLWPAVLVAGLAFGSVHLPTGITTVIPLAALGMALCWLYDRTGSLWPCVMAHAINNGIALAAVS